MKRIILILLLLTSINLYKAQSTTYGEGAMIFITYDLSKETEVNDEKYAEITKLVKTDTSYKFYCRDRKGEYFVQTFNKLKGLKNDLLEDNQYVDEHGNVYIVKDLLDSYKAMDLLFTDEIPNIPNKYRLILRCIIF